MILEARPDIEEFCSVFHNEVLRTPKPSSVHKIEKLFLKLLDACDYPAELNSQALKTMSPKEIQKYAFESNSKYAFIWELLHLVQDVLDLKVLIVARSEKILFLLKSLLLADGYAYSRTGLRDMQEGHAKWPINVVLSLPNQALAERPSDFDLIIGFDYEFKRSNIASRLAETNSGEIKQPMVLQLVITHSIEHLDLAITERDPDMPSFDHKNAIVIGLTKLRRLILNPDTGRELPHQTAERFANQLKHYNEDFVWEPIGLPDEILNFYLESSQPSQPPLEIESLQSRKRKLVSDEMRTYLRAQLTKFLILQGDTESIASKRRRISKTLGPMVNAERIEALAPIIRCLGPEVLDREDLSDETTVPTALLAAMEAKVNDQRVALQESRALVKELRRLVESLETQNNGFADSVNAIQTKHLVAVEERAKFHRERDSALLEVKRLSERLQATEEAKSKLSDEVTKLKAALPQKESTDNPGATEAVPYSSPSTKPPQEGQEANPQDEKLKQATVEVQRLTRKVENAERDLDYTRQAYQNASQSASDLGNENRELSARIKDLEHKASENLRQIHETNLRNQIDQLGKINDEQTTTLREREWELDRLRDEVRVLKAARRETRQSSVPRSPRMGMMSPRTGGRVSASRGSSPAPISEVGSGPGVPLFNQQPGNGRWGHLRD
jgi:hypothetical protein